MVPSTGPDLTLNRSHLNRSHLNRSHLGGIHLPVGPVYGTNGLHKRLQKSLLYVSVGSGSLVLTPVNMKQGGFPKNSTFFARLPLQPMRMCRNGPPSQWGRLPRAVVWPYGGEVRGVGRRAVGPEWGLGPLPLGGRHVPHGTVGVDVGVAVGRHFAGGCGD